MTDEMRYIIKHKRFEGSWTDSLSWLLLLFSGLGVFTGLNFIFLFSIGGLVWWELGLGVVVLVISSGFAVAIFNKIRTRNVFEEIRTGKDQADNFETCSQLVRVWRSGQTRRFNTNGVYKAMDIERDDWNFTIAATLLYHRYSIVRSEITIVCLDKSILINERHDFVGLVGRYGLRELMEFLTIKNTVAGSVQKKPVTQQP